MVGELNLIFLFRGGRVVRVTTRKSGCHWGQKAHRVYPSLSRFGKPVSSCRLLANTNAYTLLGQDSVGIEGTAQAGCLVYEVKATKE